MSAVLFRRLAQQCRELLVRAQTEPAKEQLSLWVAEFDAQAEEADLEEIRNRQGCDRR
jgi:hypothetical protein